VSSCSGAFARTRRRRIFGHWEIFLFQYIPGSQ
jgi:hypothetical protein